MQFLTQASSSAERVDNVFLFILALCVAFLIFITFLMVFFVIRYSKKRNPKPKDIEGHAWLEITWTAIPTVLFLAMFYYGWTNYEFVRNAPRDSMVVKVTGRQWTWQFEYPNGKKTEDLYLPIDRPMRLEVRSADVIHGFFVPAFRVKIDAVPGMENYTWFKATLLGSYDIQCTVICGADHSKMLAKAVVVPLEEFQRWYFGPDDAPPPSPGTVETAALGAPPPDHPGFHVLQQKDCLSCHSIDGREKVGPTLKGVFGSREVVKQGGEEREVTVDEAYIATSIRDPMAQIVKGYPAAMPSHQLDDAQIRHVVDFIRSLD